MLRGANTVTEMTIEYAHEQATTIVHTLGASTLPLHERLIRAWGRAFIYVISDSEKDYLSEELYQSIRLLNNRMTAREGDDEGTLQATLTRMTYRELEDCADEMIDIALRILRA
jgi:hypothetical protein